MSHTLHNRAECIHGFVHSQCRCPDSDKSVTTVSCESIPAHGQRIEELQAAEREKYPLLVHDGKAWVPFQQPEPPFTWEELNLIEDALVYFKMSCDMECTEDWSVEDVAKLLEKVEPLRLAASPEIERPGVPF